MSTTTGPTPVWRRPLKELLPWLTERLAVVPRPRVRLPHGASVGLSQMGTGQRVVRIARDMKPQTEAGERKWRVELDTFVVQLGLTGWTFAAEAPLTGVCAKYTEPIPGEFPPGDPDL